MFINDVVNCVDLLKFILFADDINLFHHSRDLSQLQIDCNKKLSRLSEWFRANKLSLNVLKTNFILFGSKPIPTNNNNFQLILDGNVIERVTVNKFLGVFLDEKLKWTQHLNHISNKISKGLGIIGRVRNIMPNDVLLTLYYSLIYPYLTYCCIVWGGASNTALHHLSVLQNRAIRLITRSPFRTSATPLFVLLKLLKVTDISRLQILLFMYKCKNKQVPVNCLNLCPLNLNHPYNMRSTNHFILFPFRTSIRGQCISTMGPRS